ncbi:MAG: hypothetical protein A2Z20_06255 [Bdellovibrionales bacterium RBG_16_40_8]|nr:MAG: hypothetical protein A2Z20_06255 [Bdellovibrionales bacterium RBG_16_40_8]
MRLLSSLILLAIFVTFNPTISWGKELTNRLGFGYSNQFSEELPSVAIRYYPDAKLGVGAALGVDTYEDNSKFGVMVRLYRIIFTEDNMNFYMGTSAGVISIEQASKTDSGFELSGYCGGEFFLTGLDNLGISFEAGVGVTSIKSQVRFRTIGDHPLKAGIIFYF